jgi:hypothetical protein
MPGYRRRVNQRLAGLSGLGFVVIYFTYMVMLEPPDISVPSSEVVDYWADSGNRAEAIVTATMCGTAVLLFVGFVVGLAQRLDDGGAAGPGHAARVAGAITATLLLVGGALFAAPALALSLNSNEPVPMDEELGLAIRTASFVAHPVMLWFTGMGAAALVAATTAGRKALGWRRWTAFVGWPLVVALLAPLVFFVLVILLLWTAVVSVWMLIFPRTVAQVTRA